MDASTLALAAITFFVVIAIAKTATIVPQRSAYIVERLGKYANTLEAGFHILIPFLDKIAYKHSLKEVALDVAQQPCITKDNIQVHIDGVLYYQVINPKDASYGIENYRFAATQLAQTTLRSVIGKIDLDKAFEEREQINVSVVEALDKAAATWGVKVLRYEIADIQLPDSIRGAMESQMRAERERRAVVATSEGHREAKINMSQGEMQEKINLAEGERISQEKRAEGKSREIQLIAEATSKGLEMVSTAINKEGGRDAVNMQLAEAYIREFGKLAKEGNTIILPAELSNIGGAVAGISTLLAQVDASKGV